MANLNLTGQAAKAADCQQSLQDMQQAMDARKELWDKLPRNKKKKWITDGNDPVMTLARTFGKFLATDFPELVEVKND